MKNFEDYMAFLASMKQDKIGKGFEELMTYQYAVSSLVPGAIVPDIPNEKVAEICFALSGEIFELAQELGWKSWKENPEMTYEQVRKIKSELGDILAFMSLLMIFVGQRTGLDGQDFADAFSETCYKNIIRFFGVSGEAGYKNLQE